MFQASSGLLTCYNQLDFGDTFTAEHLGRKPGDVGRHAMPAQAGRELRSTTANGGKIKDFCAKIFIPDALKFFFGWLILLVQAMALVRQLKPTGPAS